MTNMFLYEVKAVACRTNEIAGSHYLNLAIVLRDGETVELSLCSQKPLAIEGPVDDLLEWTAEAVVAERAKMRGGA